jgi:hypothetical protein
MFLLWLKKAWDWLKAHWKPILLGLATVGVGLLVGRALRRRQQVVNPELLGAAKVGHDAQLEEDRQRAQAAKERDEKLLQVEQEHRKTIDKLTEDQRSKVEKLREDPEELNKYLLDVGRQVRGG